MSSIRTSFTRRLALGALTSAALLASVPAMAEGQMVDVRIINRESGKNPARVPVQGRSCGSLASRVRATRSSCTTKRAADCSTWSRWTA